MPRDAVAKPKDAADSPYYSPAVRAGGFVYVSGQGPWDSALGRFAGDTIEEQTEITLRNLRAVLEQAGATMDDVVKIQAHLKNIDDFERFSQTYMKHFKAPRPARTTVGSDVGEILVEIDAVAYIGPPSA